MEWEERYTYLRELNPLSGDTLIRFAEEGHRYQFRANEEAEWEEGAPAGSFMDSFCPPFPQYMVAVVRNSLNTRYNFWHRNNQYTGKGVPYLDPRQTVQIRPGRARSVLWPEKNDVFLPSEMFKRIYEGDVESVRAEGWKVPHLDGEFTDEDVRQAWTREGTKLHGRIEAYLNQAKELPGPETREWEYFQAFLRDHPTWKPYRTELNVSLPEYGICGRVDAIFRDEATGKFILIDWKCSKKLKAKEEEDEDYGTDEELMYPFEQIPATTRNKFFIKKNVYRIAAKRSLELEIGPMYLLVLHRSNPGYVLIRIPTFSENRNKEMFDKIQVALDRFRESRKNAPKKEECDDRVEVAEEGVVPARFLCLLTRKVMEDPVVAGDGMTYERAAIIAHFAEKGAISPITMVPIESMAVAANDALKSDIEEWRASIPVASFAS